jgi:thiamine biosynthesis protein ThiS
VTRFLLVERRLGSGALAMELRLNGKTREVENGITISRLLDELALHPLQVAVEVNAEIIRREKYPGQSLQPGDTVEILTFTSGG